MIAFAAGYRHFAYGSTFADIVLAHPLVVQFCTQENLNMLKIVFHNEIT